MRDVHALAVLLACVPLVSGFDLSNSRVPAEEIVSGGPEKDGIPAISRPKHVPASGADFLDDGDRVVGIVAGREARAYPVRILNWHEVVNDTLGERPIAVTYCPLTASAVVFDREVDGRTLSFGVSGRLYQSNVLLYDHQSESLWSQLGGVAIAGPSVDTSLRSLDSVETSWKAWREAHPDTLVLSRDTGFSRDYDRDPYAGYHQASYAMFETRHADARLAVKAKVFGVRIGSESVAYPLERLADVLSVEDRVGGVAIRVKYDRVARAASVVRPDTGARAPGIVAYWFAWTAFHPETRLWGGAARVSRQDRPLGDVVETAAVGVTSHTAYWAEIPMLALDSAGNGGPGLLVIRGELTNRSGRKLHHVKLRHELLDHDGMVVAAQDGFNHGGESLASSSGVEPNEGSQADVIPLLPEGTDTFRMLFLATELPAFARYRVRVIEATIAAPGE